MTTVLIEDKTNEGKWLLNLIKGHKSVMMVESGDKQKSYSEACSDCEAVSVDAFFDELNLLIDKWPDNA